MKGAGGRDGCDCNLSSLLLLTGKTESRMHDLDGQRLHDSLPFFVIPEDNRTQSVKNKVIVCLPCRTSFRKTCLNSHVFGPRDKLHLRPILHALISLYKLDYTNDEYIALMFDVQNAKQLYERIASNIDVLDFGGVEVLRVSPLSMLHVPQNE